MAGAFVKTSRQEYVHGNGLPDARTGLARLVKWCEDYNEHHPDKGFKMPSPRGDTGCSPHENRGPVL